MRILPQVLLGQSATDSELHVRTLLHEAFGADGGVVFHSLSLPNHQYKRLGEADFVVIRSDALLVLEVKGGNISFEDGVWRYENGRGDAITRSESPMKQAESAMWAVTDLVRAARLKMPSTIGYAIVTPFSDWPKDAFPEYPAPIFLDRRDCTNTGSFERGILETARFWKERTLASGRKLSAIDVSQYETQLRPTFHAVESLATVTTNFTTESAQLTHEQIATLDSIVSNPRILVEGSAGTGKTLLCAAWANEAVRAGERTIVVVPTRGLQSLMISACPGATVLRADELASAARTGMEPHDVLLVDEGQCIGTSAFMDALDRLVRGGIEGGRWRWAMDRINQADTAMDPTILERLRGLAARCELNSNLRSARPIVEQLKLVLGADMTVGRMISHGVTPHFEDVAPKAMLDRVVATIDRWIDQGIAPSDITVIAPEHLLDTITKALPVAARGLPRMANRILVTDAHSFRGLESPAVLVVLDNPAPDDWPLERWLYLAISRARVSLSLLIGPDAKDALGQLEKLNFLR